MDDAAIELAWRAMGAPGGPALLGVHGFMGSGAAFVQIAELVPRARWVLPDLVGHGESASPTEPSSYSVEAMAMSLAGLWADSPEQSAPLTGPAHVVGYSMGGRVALALAVTRPELCRSLVIVSSTAGIADPAARTRRRADDEQLADSIEADGLPAFVRRWTALPMWAPLRARLRGPAWNAYVAARMAAEPTGIAQSLRVGGTGAMTPLWTQLGALDMPTLIVTGALDAKFAVTGRRLAEALGCARHVVVENAGHAVHLEQPHRLAELITEHLDSAAPPAESQLC